MTRRKSRTLTKSLVKVRKEWSHLISFVETLAKWREHWLESTVTQKIITTREKMTQRNEKMVEILTRGENYRVLTSFKLLSWYTLSLISKTFTNLFVALYLLTPLLNLISLLIFADRYICVLLVLHRLLIWCIALICWYKRFRSEKPKHQKSATNSKILTFNKFYSI